MHLKVVSLKFSFGNRKSHLNPTKAAGFRWLLLLAAGWWCLAATPSARRLRVGAAGLAVLLVLGRHKPDRPLGRIRRRGQLPHRVEQLAQLQPGIAAKGIVAQLQTLRPHLQIGQPLGHICIGGNGLAQMHAPHKSPSPPPGLANTLAA